MRNYLEEWLADLRHDELIVSPDNVELELKNAWWFTITHEMGISREDLSDFISELVNIRASQTTGPMTFYLWFDEMAGQIRACVTSSSSDSLPFSCNYQLVDQSEILDIWEAEKNFGSFSLAEMEDITHLSEKELVKIDAEDEKLRAEYVLKIWTIAIIPKK